MAGQSIERREILRILTLAAGAATFPGFSKWSFACGHIRNALAQIKPAVYQHASGDTSEGGGGIELAGSSLIVRMMPRIQRDL